MRRVKLLVLVLTIVFVVQLVLPASVLARCRPYSSKSTGEKVGLGIASGFCSILYVPFKITYAVLGGVTTALVTGVTIGHEYQTAKRIARKSVRGDYWVHPNCFTGCEKLNFNGPDDHPTF